MTAFSKNVEDLEDRMGLLLSKLVYINISTIILNGYKCLYEYNFDM